MLATIAAQDLIKISENTRAALAKKQVAGMQLGHPLKVPTVVAQVRALKAGGASKSGHCAGVGDVAEHGSQVPAALRET
jgi:DNA invertase Pin-like site-specific DNA recombinase